MCLMRHVWKGLVDGEDSLNEIFEDVVREEINEFLDHRDHTQKLFRLDTFNRFLSQNKKKYLISNFYIENIPKVINGIQMESKFGTDKWLGIPLLFERQRCKILKNMHDFYHEALVERFCKINFSKCDNSINSVTERNCS
ncbi:hypothetical protein HELRODRAFT_165949 [Helobdella robusta]|uniref:Uncharacterized protein n=1 Tax=Helobdella robusta TaxID=6412 RepID=T1EXH9_HELRO|nr:hypothetical protein HELRODRAFT_165949 [Helobdella robusta]ESN90300.1 hypothetical protein HELRODRAFT_165949 [Helobdella robusta]